ncbi:DASH family cryptochrome [Croceitalea sp. MTPC9]|uniref:DASH family cryptochrome n=1 Tax=unclassified Croceitalea TaxID=2632280 RepID=UPI002B398CEF|nr:DASH family cryptochrome [Croceitalea sp. MTPC6]GMN18255.1 DASH family cryptochrome [Croceitalea sp. MTPC9]
MNTLIWFRNNLRITDNISLQKACEAENTIAAYFFDPRQFQKDDFGFKKTEKFRAKFLIESVTNLKDNLKKINIPLYIFYAKPEDLIKKLIDEHKIKTIHLQAEWTRDENNVLNAVKNSLSKNIRFIESCDQFLFDPKEIPYNSFYNIPEVFTNFRKLCEKHVAIRKPVTAIESKPYENYFETNSRIPTLVQLGFKDFEPDHRSAFPFKGGEEAALKRLNDYIWNKRRIVSYKKTRNGLIGTDYSSKLSAWLANGCISPITIYWTIKEFEKEIVKNEDTYWLIFELIWRDYFKYVSLKHKHKIFDLGGMANKDYKWNNCAESLDDWINGKTTEPFVNANMIELANTGWMSNRGRQNVASYWSKGLKQDWRIGAAYFESMLIDYDVHSNWGNWMYNSGVGNDPRDRKFNIKRQADMYDPKGKFQRLWLQEQLF